MQVEVSGGGGLFVVCCLFVVRRRLGDWGIGIRAGCVSVNFPSVSGLRVFRWSETKRDCESFS